MKHCSLSKTVFGNALDKSQTLAEHLEMLHGMGLLNMGELNEQAISKKSKVDQCSKNTPNIDLVSGKQIKYAETHFRRGRWIATISRKTTAPMLVVIKEVHTRCEYFLYIPYSAHKHLSANSIALYFNKDGNPGPSQWWQYRVDSFEKLCKLAK